MQTIDDANKRLSELTAQISTLIRTLSLGVLAIVWLFLSGSSDVSHLARSVSEWELIAVAFLSILAISFDLLQYVAGYMAVALACELAKQNNKKEVTYPNNRYRKARFGFFYAKIVVAVGGALWLLVMLASAVVANFTR